MNDVFGILKLFRKHVPAKRIPQIGEQWVFKQDGPWPTTHKPVVITDVLQGYVRYDMVGFKDNRATIDTFTRMYEPYIGI